jgi:hypothetical protein
MVIVAAAMATAMRTVAFATIPRVFTSAVIIFIALFVSFMAGTFLCFLPHFIIVFVPLSAVFFSVFVTLSTPFLLLFFLLALPLLLALTLLLYSSFLA